MTEAQRHKEQADNLFRAKQFTEAATLYTTVCTLLANEESASDPLLVVKAFSNLAACQLELCQNESVCETVSQSLSALSSVPDSVDTSGLRYKLHLRHARALVALGRKLSAVSVFQSALEAKPSTKTQHERERLMESTLDEIIASGLLETPSEAQLELTLPRLNRHLPSGAPVRVVMEEGKGRSLVATAAIEAGATIADCPASKVQYGGQCTWCLGMVGDSVVKCDCGNHHCASCAKATLPQRVHKLECGVIHCAENMQGTCYTGLEFRALVRIWALKSVSSALLSPSQTGLLASLLPVCSSTLRQEDRDRATLLRQCVREAHPRDSRLHLTEAGAVQLALATSAAEFVNGRKHVTCPLVSLCNHSCRPLAEMTVDGLHVRLRAMQSIAPGQHITISYVQDVTAPERNDILNRLWGFTCTCPSCAAFEEFRQGAFGDALSHEARMEALLGLCNTCDYWCGGPLAPMGLYLGGPGRWVPICDPEVPWMCLKCGRQERMVPTPAPHESHPECLPYIEALGNRVDERSLKSLEYWWAGRRDLDILKEDRVRLADIFQKMKETRRNTRGRR
ncbi:hypothetical protein KIPB_006611, partial [Kipferlia bialata]|eukprot:g6611.t1